MIRWQRLQTSLIAITCLGVFGVLGKVILAPSAARQFAPAAFEFPAEVPLPGWQSLPSRPLDQKPNNKTAQQKLLASRLFTYQQQQIPLQIEMRYTLDTSGNVIGFLANYTSIASSTIQPSLRDERHQAGVGYYLVFATHQRAYLTSCINSQGDSTVTLPQFRHNRYTHDLRIDRIFRWLVASENIRDDRCLWTMLSMPLENTAPETAQAAYSVLTNVWIAWYHWWQPRFPQA